MPRPAKFQPGGTVLYAASVWRVRSVRWTGVRWVYWLEVGSAQALVSEDRLSAVPEGHGKVVDPRAPVSVCAWCGKAGRWAAAFCGEAHQRLWMSGAAGQAGG